MLPDLIEWGSWWKNPFWWLSGPCQMAACFIDWIVDFLVPIRPPLIIFGWCRDVTSSNSLAQFIYPCLALSKISFWKTSGSWSEQEFCLLITTRVQWPRMLFGLWFTSIFVSHFRPPTNKLDTLSNNFSFSRIVRKLCLLSVQICSTNSFQLNCLIFPLLEKKNTDKCVEN